VPRFAGLSLCEPEAVFWPAALSLARKGWVRVAVMIWVVWLVLGEKRKSLEDLQSKSNNLADRPICANRMVTTRPNLDEYDRKHCQYRKKK